jgi:hypothetical protein
LFGPRLDGKSLATRAADQADAPDPQAITGNGAMGLGMTGAGTAGAPATGPGSGVLANGFGMAATAAASAPGC